VESNSDKQRRVSWCTWGVPYDGGPILGTYDTHTSLAREAKSDGKDHGSVIARVAGRQGGRPRHQREGNGAFGRWDMGGGLVTGGLVFGQPSKHSVPTLYWNATLALKDL
jgi:hypothetical protein